MQEEIWKDIPGYEGLYQVSNLGRVKSLDRVVNAGGTKNENRVSLKKGKLLKCSLTTRGYSRVSLSIKSITKQLLIHRLIALCFLDKVEGKVNINHINGIKTDNKLSNLEYVNQRENILHSKIFLLKKKSPFVSFSNKYNRFVPSIRINNKTIKLGRFKTEEEALRAYINALKENNLENKYATICV